MRHDWAIHRFPRTDSETGVIRTSGPQYRHAVWTLRAAALTLVLAVGVGSASTVAAADLPGLAAGFRSPPAPCRPGVYWYFMDGNRTREGMTADLESMKAAGIGNVVFLEVNVGVPRGPVDFLSRQWRDLFVHAVREAERLGIEITLGSGPGWAGSGGPWVSPEQSMQHLVAVTVNITGPQKFATALPIPEPRRPFFGEASVPPKLRALRAAYYRDVAVLAFPTPRGDTRIEDIDERTLVYRAPFSSAPGVKPYLPFPAVLPTADVSAKTPRAAVLDLTDKLNAQGKLVWDVPAGNWTIMRFGCRNSGATTRPAPDPGFGFECDKFSAAALDAHFAQYIGKLIDDVGARRADTGWTTLHIDSWEMGAQNWTPGFREAFRQRRGYDPLLYLPVYDGRIIESHELSERFLWDVRLTAQELVLDNHARRLKQLGAQHGFKLSIEPYDMNPTSDLELGAVADIPMCEFWSAGVGFDTSFSCIEATSIAHTEGHAVVAAEAFTADRREAWTRYPGNLKNQGDWAFCTGINRLVYHTFAHKPYGRRPGMTMGPYGVHWDRGQTWWPMAAAYHRFVSRCQYMLRQGTAVADILYLAAEGAPNVFRPPLSALQANGSMPDRRGYNFDGCAPSTLLRRAHVVNGRICFDGGSDYQLLVLPQTARMTPDLLAKIAQLVRDGASVIGSPPVKSPSLVGYPECDDVVRNYARQLWGRSDLPDKLVTRSVGKGRVLFGGPLRAPSVVADEPPAISDAKWIWFPEGRPQDSAAPGVRFFRRAVSITQSKQVKQARVEMTADNALQLWVNGHSVLEGTDFHTVYRASITDMLSTGNNTLAVLASNSGDTANPAGLIGALIIEYTDGTRQQIVTDSSWQTATTTRENWRTTTDGAATWQRAAVLGPTSMSPWRLKPQPNPCPELYPNYAPVAALLADMGIPQDFVSTGPVRYTHRRVADIDLYYVANRSSRVIRTECRFRTVGHAPELWDPVRGTTRPLPVYSAQQHVTVAPLRFEPYQSYFVVFRNRGTVGNSNKAANGPAPAKQNFRDRKSLVTVTGSWRVSFDPALGGPADIAFTTLSDWSTHRDPAVKYYSGIAVYRTTLNIPSAQQPNLANLQLDLGTVHCMARVRLNGHDCGVAWCAPWRVDIGQAARLGDNTLEIEVANLWPNRLIRDQQLPADQRVTWTTFNPYSKNAALLPSGLLGPVTVQAARGP